MTLYRGWFQIAFAESLATAVTPVKLGSQRLILVSDPSGRLRAFDADCPHRGADLSLGALDGDFIVCAFHGHRIHLGEDPARGFCVREHEVLSLSGAIFVRLNDGADLGLAACLRDLDRRCWVVPGFEMSMRARHELVAENAFDGAHFHSVHQVRNHPRVEIARGESGELVGTGILEVPRSTWQTSVAVHDNVAVPITVRAYSPGVVVTDMGGARPYAMVTTATPTADGCTVRLSFAMPRSPGADGPDRRLCDYMIQQARNGLEADRIIWESLSPGHLPHYLSEDASVIAYREFCAQFERSN
jgi:nitrite reductase/ring-hydroxylating ferredoxin subunit